jgi:hypothetical protein
MLVARSAGSPFTKSTVEGAAHDAILRHGAGDPEMLNVQPMIAIGPISLTIRMGWPSIFTS